MVIQRIQWHIRAGLCRAWASTHVDSFHWYSLKCGVCVLNSLFLMLFRIVKKKTWKRIARKFWPHSLHYKPGSSSSRLPLAEFPLTTIFKTSNEEPWMSVPVPQQSLTVPSHHSYMFWKMKFPLRPLFAKLDKSVPSPDFHKHIF